MSARRPKFAMNDDIIDNLKGVLDLPDHITALTLELKMDELPVVHATFYPDLTPLGEFVKDFKRAQTR